LGASTIDVYLSPAWDPLPTDNLTTDQKLSNSEMQSFLKLINDRRPPIAPRNLLGHSLAPAISVHSDPWNAPMTRLDEDTTGELREKSLLDRPSNRTTGRISMNNHQDPVHTRMITTPIPQLRIGTPVVSPCATNSSNPYQGVSPTNLRVALCQERPCQVSLSIAILKSQAHSPKFLVFLAAIQPRAEVLLVTHLRACDSHAKI
jgi:hypothetical protein